MGWRWTGLHGLLDRTSGKVSMQVSMRGTPPSSTVVENQSVTRLVCCMKGHSQGVSDGCQIGDRWVSEGCAVCCCMNGRIRRVSVKIAGICIPEMYLVGFIYYGYGYK